MSAPELQPITDHAAVVLPLVISQYQNATRLLGLVRTGCAQADDLESALYQIRSGYWVSQAVGVQLDILGKVYGEGRLGRSDTDYRTAILARALTIVSGTPEEIMAFLRFTFGMSDATYLPEYPAGYVIGTEDTTSGAGMLDDLSPAGVQGLYGNPMLDALGDPMLSGTGEPIYGVRS